MCSSSPDGKAVSKSSGKIWEKYKGEKKMCWHHSFRFKYSSHGVQMAICECMLPPSTTYRYIRTIANKYHSESRDASPACESSMTLLVVVITFSQSMWHVSVHKWTWTFFNVWIIVLLLIEVFSADTVLDSGIFRIYPERCVHWRRVSRRILLAFQWEVLR